MPNSPDITANTTGTASTSAGNTSDPSEYIIPSGEQLLERYSDQHSTASDALRAASTLGSLAGMPHLWGRLFRRRHPQIAYGGARSVRCPDCGAPSGQWCDQRTLGRYADALDLRESDARYEAQRAFLDDDAAALYALLARAWRYFELSVEDPAGWRLINLFLVSPRRIIEDQTHLRLMALVSAQLQRVAALSDEAVGAGALRPGRGLNRALVVFATLNGHLQYLKLAHTSGLGFTPAHTVSLGLDTVLAGWGARAEARDAAWKLLRHHAELAVPQLDS